MEFRAFFKQMATSPALRAYAERKLLGPIDIYVRRPIEAHITFSVEAGVHRARCHIHGGGGLSVQVEASDPDSMYTCVDRLQDRLEERLRRRKERISAHKVRGDVVFMPPPATRTGPAIDDDSVDAAYVINFEKARRSLGERVQQHGR